MIINERGAINSSEGGLPGKNAVMNGLSLLEDYLVERSGIYSPKIVSSQEKGDYLNYIMLTYYRNPLNHIFFNESIILASIHSFGLEESWQLGVDMDQLFDRCCYLSELLKYEEFIQHRISKDNRAQFERTVEFMIQKRTLLRKRVDGAPSNLLLLRTSGES